MKTLKIIMLMAVLTLVWGCSSDDGDDNTNPNITFTQAAKPEWTIDWSWNDPLPTWQDPDPEKYEARMYITLRLADEYKHYSTDDDLMAIFCGDECRGVSGPSVTDRGIVYFPIMVHGTPGSDKVELLDVKYYCSGMKQIFTRELLDVFHADRITGGSEDVLFEFGLAGTKYVPLTGKFQMTGNVPFTVSEDDVIGVFVGNECRGTGKVGSEFLVWKRPSDDESFTVRYYSAEKAGIYTSLQTFQKNKWVDQLEMTIYF